MIFLRISLWFGAAASLLAAPFMILPWQIVENVFSFFSLGGMATNPASIYFFRMTCAFSVFIGIFYIILAVNPLKYPKLLWLCGIGFSVISVLSLMYGIGLRMLPYWFLVDTIICGLVGVTVIIFKILKKC